MLQAFLERKHVSKGAGTPGQLVVLILQEDRLIRGWHGCGTTANTRGAIGVNGGKKRCNYATVGVR